MISAHTRLNNSYCSEIVSSLDSYLDGKKNLELARVLRIHPKQSAQVKSLEYQDISESLALKYRDSLNTVLPFKVNACVYNVNVLDTLQTAILSYMESNNLAAKLKEFDREVYLRTIDQLEREIAQNDSLKKLINNSIIPRGPSSGLIYGEPLDPVNVYRRTMDLFDKKVATEIKLKNINTFDVAVDFNKSMKQSGPGMFSFTLTGTFIGYIIGVIIIYRKRRKI
jgi:hypothetical protein